MTAEPRDWPEWLEQAIDVGIEARWAACWIAYPKSSPDGDRTPWQDGWNAACIAISEAIEAALPIEDEAELASPHRSKVIVSACCDEHRIKVLRSMLDGS